MNRIESLDLNLSLLRNLDIDYCFICKNVKIL